jgi:DNA topoisomerase-3
LHTVFTEVEQEMFKTNVKQLIDLGWKVVYQGQDQTKEATKSKKGSKDEDEEQEDEVSSAFSVDPLQSVNCIEAIMKEKETQPPKHFTEGTLLKAMESAGKQVEDDELREAMKDAGLGTPATRAATIERLKQVEYIDMQGKKIMISSKGKTAIELIRSAGVELLTSPEMTGQWERRLNEIAKGAASDTTFMDNVKKFTILIVNKVRLQPRAAKEAFIRVDKPKASKNSTTKKATATTAKKETATSASKSSAPQKLSRESITACPRAGCGGHIFMGNKGYGCSHYKEGCSFVIWKSSFGKSLTTAMVKTLIEKGSTNRLKLTNEAGEVFDGKILLKDTNTGQLVIDAI